MFNSRVGGQDICHRDHGGGAGAAQILVELTLTRSILVLALSAAVTAAGLAAPAAAATVSPPGRVTAVTASPGPGPGQVTFTWKQDGTHTTSFALETGLTTFKVGDPVLPDHGRNARTFTLAAWRRSITLSAAQVALAGAPTASANHLYYRFRAVNHTSSGTTVRDWPYLQNVAVAPAAAPAGTALRVASFNVHTATASTGVRPWSQRVSGVADTILSRSPGVVALQELGIGRADGTNLSTTGALTQDQSLVSTLHARGGTRYQLVREGRYVPPGTAEAIQGARLLYDSSRYRLVSSCADTAPQASWSPSCTIALPLLPGDNGWLRRHAAYAVFADRATGKQFFLASVHLDQRQSTSWATERRYEQLRATQVKAVMTRLNTLNTGHLPIVLAGDLNTWQNNQFGYDAHDAMVAGGYYDTAAARSQVNVRFTTMNHFATTVPTSTTGWGSRLDVITVKGATGAARFENVMRVTDSNRPSDHNMVVADLRLP